MLEKKFYANGQKIHELFENGKVIKQKQ